MKVTRLLHWLRGLNTLNKTNVTNRTIEDALEVSAQRLQAFDPETDKQWQRVKVALTGEESTSGARRTVNSKIRIRPAFSFAIACAVLVAVGVLWLRHASIKTYETAKGQHSSITLQDSTEVTLNYMSELKVNRWPLEKARRVSLKGEALFHVRRNGTPFILTTDVGTVQVLGTQFNVRVRDDRMEVAVLNGSVKMSVNRNGIDSSVVLSKGQIAVCAKNDFPGMPGTLPFSEYPGWMHGKFMFYRSSLLSACKELESQFDIVIKIEKPQLQDVTITGIIDAQGLKVALTTLVQLTGNKFRYEDGSYIIY
jgi:ferric-dicitrate binding protein FerR (iron transport regulator)